MPRSSAGIRTEACSAGVSTTTLNKRNSYPDVSEQRKWLYWNTFMPRGSYYVTSRGSFPLNSHLLRHQFNLFCLSLSRLSLLSLLALLSFRNRCTEQPAALSLSLLLLNIPPSLSFHFSLSRCVSSLPALQPVILTFLHKPSFYLSVLSALKSWFYL